MTKMSQDKKSQLIFWLKKCYNNKMSKYTFNL